MSNRKNCFLIGILVLLVILLCGQGYYVYHLHQKLDTQSKASHEGDTAFSLNLKDDDIFGRSPWTLPDPDDRDLNSWNPLDEMRRMQEQMDNMFGSAFSRFSRDPHFGRMFQDRSFSPKLDIEEEDDQYLVTVDIPGAEKSTIEVEIENGQMRIEGRTQRSEKDEQFGSPGGMIRQERFFGSFNRVLPLPDDIDETGVKQEYKNGVLTIIIPKKR